MNAMAAARRALGPLGRRLLAAFVLVALSSVAVLTAAALIGTDRGVATIQHEERQQVAERTAATAAEAFAAAGGWAGADLDPVHAVAEAAGARLVVWDATGAVVSMTAPMGRHGHAAGQTGQTGQTGQPGLQADVVVDGQSVGTVQLTFLAAAVSSSGRAVAWWWVAGAAAVALVIALGVSWYVTRRLTTPLATLAGTARAFAGGHRAARVGIRPPGELGEVAAAFDAMADEVATTEENRRRQAADVAHELRNPLAALQAGLEELRDGLGEPDPARLASLHDQALRLGRVVEDLAQLASAEAASASLRLTELDLATAVAGTVDSQEPQLRAAGLIVHREISGPVPVRADPDRIHQIVVNMLANAARFGRSGDHVTVRVFSEGERGLVQVADTGPGIAATDIPHVFERRWRGPNSGTVTGSGIGLAVVRELVEAHHGTVSVDSRPGHGTTFTIMIPLGHDQGNHASHDPALRIGS
ncbi:MAG TPA: HAMP domain-containing sensor histidine kinase [Jiangellaceae bacterium]|nr:HAMP domain-containing sensor histidine kinase [Jiangellaceae bacterium]